MDVLIAEYRASGLGLKRFARERKIRWARLHYWVYQKQRGRSRRSLPRRSAATATSAFQEVKLPACASLVASWAAEVSLPKGKIVRFSGAAIPAWIGSVVQALERPC